MEAVVLLPEEAPMQFAIADICQSLPFFASRAVKAMPS